MYDIALCHDFTCYAMLCHVMQCHANANAKQSKQGKCRRTTIRFETVPPERSTSLALAFSFWQLALEGSTYVLCRSLRSRVYVQSWKKGISLEFLIVLLDVARDVGYGPG